MQRPPTSPTTILTTLRDTEPRFTARDTEPRFKELEMRMERCEAMSKMHDQMYRLKQEEKDSTKLSSES